MGTKSGTALARHGTVLTPFKGAASQPLHRLCAWGDTVANDSLEDAQFLLVENYPMTPRAAIGVTQFLWPTKVGLNKKTIPPPLGLT